MDYPAEQEMELEALEAILADDLTGADSSVAISQQICTCTAPSSALTSACKGLAQCAQLSRSAA